MPTRLIPAAPLALALVLALAACGGSNGSGSVVPVTVTVNQPAPATTTLASPSPAPQRTTTQQTTTTPAPSQTRTGTAPAFVSPTGGTQAGGDLPAAVAKLRQLGFAPTSTASYGQNETLRVLVGSRTGTSHTQQAFFFNGTRYLGTDAAGPSGQIAVTSHGDTDVTLRYGIYRPADGDCCPSGSPASVRYQLDRGRLVALDPIPSAATRR